MRLRSTLLGIFLIILFSLPGIWALFKPGFYPSHDGEGHIVRLGEFDISLKDGQIPVRMDKNLMYGYGYYFFNFNYPLVYWAGEAAHLVGFGFVDAIKIVLLLGMVGSGIVMFLWQKNHWGFWGGLLAGVFYMYAPYRLLNLYVRASVAEHLAFIFLPLLFMFTEKIAEGDKHQQRIYLLLGGLSYAGLMMTHNITAFIFTLVLGIFMIFHFIIHRKLRLLFNFSLIGIIGLALSAFFWVPSLLEKKYVRLDQTIGQDYHNSFINFFQLVKRSWGYGSGDMSLQIGWFHWGVAILALFFIVSLFKNHRQKALHIVFYLVILVLSILLMLPISRLLWDHFPLLPFTQFPWRFLSWSVFATSVLSGAVIFYLDKNFGQRHKLLVPAITLTISGLLIATSFWYYQPLKSVPIKMWGDQPLPGSTTWADEQFPIWFDPKPTSIPVSHVMPASAYTSVNIQSWKTGEHQYSVDSPSGATLIENTAFYPGWKVFVDGSEVKINYQDPDYPGRLVFSAPAGNHNITSSFTETPLRMTVDLISLATFLVVTMLLIVFLIDRKRAAIFTRN